VEVTAENLERYIEGVTGQVIGAGIQQQLEAFKAGFEEVLSFFSFFQICFLD
jgi:hypothetical protein